MLSRFLAIVLSLALFPAAAATVGIDWGTSIQTEKIITSDGSGVSLGAFKVEVGGFSEVSPGVPFVPTSANITEWMSHWQVFDAITATFEDYNPSTDTYSDFFFEGAPTLARFGGSDSLTTGQVPSPDAEDAIANNPGATFPTTMRGYIFIRNRDDFSPGAEWALFTNQSGGGIFADNPWFFPSTSGIPFTEGWEVIEADLAVVGAIHGGLSVGDGEFTDASSDYLIRTHNVAAMPEPSPAVSLLAAFALLLKRRLR